MPPATSISASNAAAVASLPRRFLIASPRSALLLGLRSLDRVTGELGRSTGRSVLALFRSRMADCL